MIHQLQKQAFYAYTILVLITGILPICSFSQFIAPSKIDSMIASGDWVPAQRLIDIQLMEDTVLNSPPLHALFTEKLADVETAQNRYSDATEHYRASMQLYEAMNDSLGNGRVLLKMAKNDLEGGNSKEALQYAKVARHIFRDLGDLENDQAATALIKEIEAAISNSAPEIVAETPEIVPGEIDAELASGLPIWVAIVLALLLIIAIILAVSTYLSLQKTKEDLEKLKAAVPKIKEKYSALKKEKVTIESKIEGKDAKIRDLRHEMDKRTMRTVLSEMIQSGVTFAEYREGLEEKLPAVLMKKHQDELGNLLRFPSNSAVTEERWVHFDTLFQKVYPKFFPGLINEFPDITANERRLCQLLVMELTSKDISLIFQITHHAVDVARYRLRKKMNLDRKEGLDQKLSGYI